MKVESKTSPAGNLLVRLLAGEPSDRLRRPRGYTDRVHRCVLWHWHDASSRTVALMVVLCCDAICLAIFVTIFILIISILFFINITFSDILLEAEKMLFLAPKRWPSRTALGWNSCKATWAVL